MCEAVGMGGSGHSFLNQDAPSQPHLPSDPTEWAPVGAVLQMSLPVILLDEASQVPVPEARDAGVEAPDHPYLLASSPPPCLPLAPSLQVGAGRVLHCRGRALGSLGWLTGAPLRAGPPRSSSLTASPAQPGLLCPPLWVFPLTSSELSLSQCRHLRTASQTQTGQPLTASFGTPDHTGSASLAPPCGG